MNGLIVAVDVVVAQVNVVAVVIIMMVAVMVAVVMMIMMAVVMAVVVTVMIVAVVVVAMMVVMVVAAGVVKVVLFGDLFSIGGHVISAHQLHRFFRRSGRKVKKKQEKGFPVIEVEVWRSFFFFFSNFSSHYTVFYSKKHLS